MLQAVEKRVKSDLSLEMFSGISPSAKELADRWMIIGASDII